MEHNKVNGDIANCVSKKQLELVGNGGDGGYEDGKLLQMFDTAVNVIQRLPKDGPYQPSNSTKLRFYSLYKQATEGKCTEGQPSIFYLIDRAKWDAWSRLGNMSKVGAMQEYVTELKKIVETMSLNGDVQNFLEAVNPFYEFVALQGEEMATVKDSLDEWSSSESNSAQTSTQGTPMHNGVQSRLAAENGVHAHINGHACRLDNDSVEGIAKAEKHADTRRSQTFASSFHPPFAPIHHRSITGCSTSDFDVNFRIDSNSEDVLKVDHGENPTKLYPRLSADNIQSGTESEVYYSGCDSEPDVDGRIDAVHHASPIFALPGNSPSSEQLMSQSSSTSDVNLILANTVERLNRDVDHILARVRLLEAAYATNDQLTQAVRGVINGRTTVGGLTRPGFSLVIVWPFIAYFIIKLVKLWIRRRRGRI